MHIFIKPFSIVSWFFPPYEYYVTFLLACCTYSQFIEGDIGGYPIPQYRKKKWQIPKYRFENRLNTDTAYFNHIYNRFRILIVASI